MTDSIDSARIRLANARTAVIRAEEVLAAAERRRDEAESHLWKVEAEAGL